MSEYHSYDELPLTLTVDDLKDALNIGRNAAYDLIRSGQIFSLKIGKTIRVPKDAIMDYIRGGAAS